MRSPFILAWWLCLLACLQVAALVLDQFHHMGWGQIGIHLLKGCYLGFSVVLFIRYLSFRAQRNFETLVESYNRLANANLTPDKVRKESWVNPFWNLVLVVIASINFTLVFNWNEAVFKVSVWLDFIIWAVTVRWLVRVYWLKSQGARERLKEVLDDARSRMKAEKPIEGELVGNRVSKLPFAVLAIMSFCIGLGISLQRWHEVREVFRVDDLKECMDRTMRVVSKTFYQQGTLEIDEAAFPCVSQRQEKVDISLSLHQGELLMHAAESFGSDYFGNGVVGDEGLVLDATGRFRRAWSVNFKEP